MKGKYLNWGGRKIVRRKDVEGKCGSCGKEEVEMIEVERKEGESEEVCLVMEVCKNCKYVVEFGLGKEDW